MYPYGGIEPWIFVTLGVLLAIAVAVVIFAFKQEAKEKAAEDPTVSKKHRHIKYALFAGVFSTVMGGLVLGLAAPTISEEAYHRDIVAHIESQNVKLVEGFVDPSIPLRAGEHAKFVVETENGLVRCRATAEDKNKEINFTCQDYGTEDWDFIVPLAEINEHLKELDPEDVANADEATAGEADIEDAGSEETEPASEG